MDLSNLQPPRDAKRRKKRVGRGPGSGHGKTAGRGHKGQKSRSGFKRKRGFEGGQMPLHRRVPKRGFHNPFRVEYAVVNVDSLANRFDAGTEVTPDVLRAHGLVTWSRHLGESAGSRRDLQGAHGTSPQVQWPGSRQDRGRRRTGRGRHGVGRSSACGQLRRASGAPVSQGSGGAKRALGNEN